MRALVAGEEAPFLLDTTMAVVRRRDGQGRALLTLISPVKCDEATLAHIKARSSICVQLKPVIESLPVKFYIGYMNFD